MKTSKITMNPIYIWKVTPKPISIDKPTEIQSIVADNEGLLPHVYAREYPTSRRKCSIGSV